MGVMVEDPRPRWQERKPDTQPEIYGTNDSAIHRDIMTALRHND
jgi:hypothetical protein